MNQIIITVGRENGSGGRDIAARIAEQLHIPMYDAAVLKEAVSKMNPDIDPGAFSRYEEVPRKLGSSRKIAGHTNSVEEIITELEFEFIKEKAKSGESFVIVGRCADRLLKEYNCLVKFFIRADADKKIKRIALRHGVEENEAMKLAEKTDKKRKKYYETYSGGVKWGDSSWHDIVINSSRLGIDKTAKFLADFAAETDRAGKY